MIGRVFCAVAALTLCLPTVGLPDASAWAAGQRPAKPGAKAVKSVDGDAVPSSEADPLTPVDSNAGPALAPGSAAALAKMQTQPAGEVDPLVAEVRRRLAEPRSGAGNGDKADRAGLAAFYALPGAAPVWTTKTGLSPRGEAAAAEIRKADDWGLEPSAFELPTLAAGEPTPEALAEAEIKLSLAVLKYARHARGGRLDPQSLSHLFNHKPRLFEPRSVMLGIAAADAADAYLRGLHPKHTQFEKLRQAWVAARGKTTAPAPEDKLADIKIPAGPKLKPGSQHAQVALLHQRLGVAAETGKEALYDDLLVKAVMAYQGEHGIEPNGIIGNDTRTALNGAARHTSSENTQRLLVNMERWRWMPDDLGAFHVLDSVPEQIARVYNNGKLVFQEKIVVGKLTTPTPIFTANMQFVIFHPEWGVPDGIKVNELAPLLRRASNDGGWFFGGGGNTASNVLRRVGGLRPSINGRPVDPDQVNWSAIDIRQVQFVQPAGGPNVLGQVKFRFPNKHDVYMHDTPERNLFNNGTRAFSHGCMRVQNPIKLAEVLLEHDKGWSTDKVQGLVSHGGTTDVKLGTEIPVHVTYFTARVDDDGKVHYYGDIYGLDNRVASALSGRQVQLVADRTETGKSDGAGAERSSDPAVRAERQLKPRPRVAARAKAVASGEFNPFAGLFGN